MPSPTSRPQWHLRRGALGRRGRALWRLHRRAEQHPRRPQHLLSLLPSCPRPPWPSKILARSTQMTGSTCLMKCPKVYATDQRTQEIIFHYQNECPLPRG
ncbi:hypothetical protein PVAP13_7KG082700 [Panicum virgatum]|nr:hypothetical protein PVAP13_7KG082700 [Panicum virgatum]